MPCPWEAARGRLGARDVWLHPRREAAAAAAARPAAPLAQGPGAESARARPAPDQTRASGELLGALPAAGLLLAAADF